MIVSIAQSVRRQCADRRNTARRLYGFLAPGNGNGDDCKQWQQYCGDGFHLEIFLSSVGLTVTSAKQSFSCINGSGPEPGTRSLYCESTLVFLTSSVRSMHMLSPKSGPLHPVFPARCHPMRLKLDVHRLQTSEDDVSMIIVTARLHLTAKSLQDCHQLVRFPCIPSMGGRPVGQ